MVANPPKMDMAKLVNGSFTFGKLTVPYISLICNMLYLLTGNCILRESNENEFTSDYKYRLDKSLVKRVLEIKLDCGSLCDTSLKVDKQLHRGNEYHLNSVIK